MISQAGSVGEWPEGPFEAEVRTAAVFAGESFAVDCAGQVIARRRTLEEDPVIAETDLGRSAGSTARRLFWPGRRPDLHPDRLR